VPLFFEAIKFQESIFALPFAYSGMVLAADGFPTWRQVVWITVAMVSARTLGMSANRIIDRRIDARNPRTAARHLATGALRVWDMAVLAAVALGVLLLAAAQLNTLTLVLVPVAAASLVIYPWLKRFTWFANFFLGWVLAIAPAGAWIGVRGSLSWELVLLSSAVGLWATSFDILYHTQDRQFYLGQGLHSVAQRFGNVAAFRCARALDILALVCLVGLGSLMGLPYPYFVGCALAMVLLAYKHIVVSPDDLSWLGTAFFRINAYVSVVMFVSILIAVLLD
jgi:4-hydroxybenzoate polyprenyltransferase